MFRAGLLEGRRIAVGDAAPALAARLTGLGAVLADGQGGVDDLVVDARAGAGDLVAWSGAVWERVRGVAAEAWIEAQAPGGRVVLLAPPPGPPGAEAARAALENLARTLSIEWARFGIRPTCVTPGAATGEEELADLVAYLLSPAGAYFSGCRLTLGGAAG